MNTAPSATVGLAYSLGPGWSGKVLAAGRQCHFCTRVATLAGVIAVSAALSELWLTPSRYPGQSAGEMPALADPAGTSTSVARNVSNTEMGPLVLRPGNLISPSL